MDLQKIFDAMGSMERASRSNYHLCLGQLIEELSAIPGDAPVRLDYLPEQGPGEPGSYRGYYSDLAFEFGPPTTVSAWLSDSRKTLGKTLEGYKGGDFLMGADTPLWVSNYGDNSGRAIMGLVVVDGEVVVQTLDTHARGS